MSVDWNAVKDALYDFVETELASLPGGAPPILWTGQKVTRDAYPYVRLAWLTGDIRTSFTDSTKRTFDDGQALGEELLEEKIGPRERGLSVTFHGAPNDITTPLQAVSDLATALEHESVNDALRTAIPDRSVVLNPDGAAIAVPDVANDAYIHSAVQDFIVRVTSVSGRRTGYVEQIAVTGDVSGIDISKTYETEVTP